MARRAILHLIRHEKTQANVERKYIGWTDEPIVAPVTATITVQSNIIYGSDLKRCEQTAAGYFPHANYHALSGLRETNFGDFEMKTYEQLQHNVTYRAWIDDPVNVTPPNGENFIAFEQRVVDTIKRIIKTPGTYPFVVHGGVIRVLLAHFGMIEQSFQQVTANHRTMYTLTWENIEQFLGGARCTSFSEAPITVSENTPSN